VTGWSPYKVMKVATGISAGRDTTVEQFLAHAGQSVSAEDLGMTIE
jgi:biotin carboxyl carrier protein